MVVQQRHTSLEPHDNGLWRWLALALWLRIESGLTALACRQIYEKRPRRLAWRLRLAHRNLVAFVIVLVEELAWLVSVDAYVGVQANDFTAPNRRLLIAFHKVLEWCLFLELLGKGWIVDLETVIDPDCFASFWDAGSGGQWQGREEGYVTFT